MAIMRALAGMAPWIMACVLFYVFDGTFISTVLGWALLLIAAFMAAVASGRLIVVRRFFHEFFEGDSEDLARLRATTGRLFLSTSTFTYAVANALLFLVGAPYLCVAIYLGLNWWSIPAVLAAGLWNIGMRQLNPPLAVFLSTSTIDRIALCAELQHRVFPLRMMNMLDIEAVKAAQKQQGVGLGIAALDGNRLIKSENWEETISDIMSSVPLIIIDLRESSLNLGTECGLINKEGLHWKLVAVHDRDIGVEQLESRIFGSGKRPAGEIAWLSSDRLPKTIVHSVIVEKRRPARDRPAGQLLVTPAHDYGEWLLWQKHPPRLD
jgi:hypothetical protein